MIGVIIYMHVFYFLLFWFGLFVHSITHVTLDMSITDYNLYITTQLIICGYPLNII